MLRTRTHCPCRLLAEGAPAAEAPELDPTVQRFSREGKSADGGGALPWLQPPNSFSGDGTAFSDAVNNTGAAFACSFRYVNDKFSRHFAAINQEQVRQCSSLPMCTPQSWRRLKPLRSTICPLGPSLPAATSKSQRSGVLVPFSAAVG